MCGIKCVQNSYKGNTVKSHGQSGRCGNCRQYNKMPIGSTATAEKNRNRTVWILSPHTPPPPA